MNKYVIYSFDHQAWWAPNHCGYVDKLCDAGRYSEQEAGAIHCRSIFLEDLAILHTLAEEKGPPQYHPWYGEINSH